MTAVQLDAMNTQLWQRIGAILQVYVDSCLLTP